MFGKILGLLTFGALIYSLFQNRRIMSQNEKLIALTERLNGATNEIANDLTALKQQISEGRVTEEALAKLEQNVAKLEAMGADGDNPVPEDPATGDEGTGSEDDGEGTGAGAGEGEGEGDDDGAGDGTNTEA